jgi:hypothetical protein
MKGSGAPLVKVIATSSTDNRQRRSQRKYYIIRCVFFQDIDKRKINRYKKYFIVYLKKKLLTICSTKIIIILMPQVGGDCLVARKKPGPKPEHPKNFTLRVRVDEITLNKLDNCVKKANSNRSDVVRQGIDLMDEKLRK